MYQHPGTFSRVLSKAMKECGYEWVTAKIWRKTVAAVMDEAGITTTEGADQLGNTPAIYERHYRPPRASNTKQAAALETVWESDDEE